LQEAVIVSGLALSGHRSLDGRARTSSDQKSKPKAGNDLSESASVNAGSSTKTTNSNARPQGTLLEIVNTPNHGRAVFTTRKVKAGTLLLAEHPLIVLSKSEENNYDAIEREFSLLPKPQQKIYKKLFDAEKSRMSRVVSIYNSNCYNCEGWKTDGTGGSAIGELASRFNHSCLPNAQFSYHEETNEMRFHAIRDIPRGKEVFTNYFKNQFKAAAKRNGEQMMHYGFMCRCDACEPKTEFWARSDERRVEMQRCLSAAAKYEENFGGYGGDQQIVQAATATLERLEGLLRKEGLVGTPLVKVYRSLAKWTSRTDDVPVGEVIQWTSLERATCVTSYGIDSLRTQEADSKLDELREQVERAQS
jgi:hypothetical protein